MVTCIDNYWLPENEDITQDIFIMFISSDCATKAMSEQSSISLKVIMEDSKYNSLSSQYFL